ncbi:MAG: homoserine kinase [Gemmatimonadota bacterium]|nr:homoserine kinase [Gemmatimonadota bacterium]
MIGIRVPASTSNLGAGFDCLGLALDLWMHVRVVDGVGEPVYSGTVNGMDRRAEILMSVVGDALESKNHLEIHSEIPIAKGLGSSAAAAVAGFALRQLLHKQSLDRDAVYESAVDLEGHPDNAGAATYGGFVLAAPRPARLAFNRNLGVALAVPNVPIDTKAARQILPHDLPRDVTIRQASRAAALVLGLMNAEGDLIAYGMDDQIAVPLRKKLISGYDEAVAAGKEAGAYGVTISGSGSAVVAITPVEEVDAVAEAMAVGFGKAGNPAEPMTPEVTERGVAVME